MKKNRINKSLKKEDIIAKVGKKHKWKGNLLQAYAEITARTYEKEEEVEKIDMTEVFFKELERAIKNREIIIIQINSKPRLGKSTLGIMIGMHIFELLKENNFKKKSKKFGLFNIARDEQEKSKKMRDPELMYDVIVTDEKNTLESKTGENVTVEEEQRKVHSDVQAGRYIHAVYICPFGDMDDNADIKLIVRNREKGLIHSKLFYKLHGQWIILGKVIINVKNLIKNWLKIEPTFMRYLKNGKEKDKKAVLKWRKSDFYVEYQARKYEKMELMNKEGILRPRELDYAHIQLRIIEKLKNLSSIMSLAQLKLSAQGLTEAEYRNSKIPVTMVGIEMTVRRVIGILGYYKTIEDLRNKMVKIICEKNADKVFSKERTNKIESIKKQIEEVKGIAETQIAELERYKELNEKYHEYLN